MKKELIILILLLIFLLGCAKVSEKEIPLEKSEKGLDDLQIAACEEADKAGTCQTRLIDVGIVMPDECCEVAGVCCSE